MQQTTLQLTVCKTEHPYEQEGTVTVLPPSGSGTERFMVTVHNSVSLEHASVHVDRESLRNFLEKVMILVEG